MEDKNENNVIIQSNVDIDQNDIDLITMFFESKKQSSGGDTVSSEKIGSRLMKFNFEEFQAKKRVLEKKYFSFKKYQFKSYNSGIMGYQDEGYPLITNYLIIKDILLDSDFESGSYDDSVVKMYAEHLSPDNEVIRIQKSHLLENTFIVHYKENLDNNQVMNRYKKRSKLRNQLITILECFNTKSFIIAYKQSKKQKIDNIFKQINEEIEKRDDIKNYFMEKNRSNILVQCEVEKTFDELKDVIKLSLKSIDDDLFIEDVFNFKLLDMVKNQNSNIEHVDQQAESFGEMEIVQSQEVPENEISQDKESTETVKINRTQLKRKAKAEKVTMGPVEEKKDEYLCIEKIKMNEMNLSNLFKSQTDSEIILNEESPFSIGLINCYQLRLRLTQLMSKHKADLYFNKKNKYKPLVLKFGKESISKIINIVKNFAKTHFIYKIVHLSQIIIADTALMTTLTNYLPNLNRQYPGLYLKLIKSSLHCYGYPKSVGKVLNTNYGLLKEIMEKRDLSNKQTVQEKIKTKSNDLDLPTKQESKKPRTSGLKSEKIDVSKLNIQTSFTDNTDNEKTEWKIKIEKRFKEEKKSYTNENSIVLYNSYEPIESIKTIDIKNSNKINLVLIDPVVYKVLSICLRKCKKIALDFIDDLKLVSNECKLAFVKGEMEQCGVIIETNDEKYIETYKTGLEKIFNFYEKNRLKHVYNLIEEKLKRDEIFPTLISNFSSRKELDDLKIILNMIYLDEKVVHAELTNKKLIEIYGYTNAVQNYDNYAIEILNKTTSYYRTNVKSLLAFKLRQKENPKIQVFFKFDGNYFNDFVMQTAAYDAHVVKLHDQKAIHIACFNKKLRNNAHNLDVVDNVYNWRDSMDAFIFQYLELFGIEQFKVPFTRDSQECQSVIYDKSLLEVYWVDDNEIEVIGVQQEIEKLKLKLL